MNVWEPKYWENTGFNSMWDVCGLLSKMSSGAKAKKKLVKSGWFNEELPQKERERRKVVLGLKSR